MKKILMFIGIFAVTLLLTACGNKEKLNLYIPNEYIDSSLVKAFEKEHNVRVKIITFNSNEVALGQVRANKYDIVVPSDYAIEELAKEGLLEELNGREFFEEGLEFAPGLEAFFEQLNEDGFDFLKYSVPYFWGSLGVLYNHNKITLDRMEKDGYKVIADQSLETIIYDSSRDAIMVGLLANGKILHDANRDEATLKADLKQAEEWLVSSKGPKTSILSDEILTDMLSGTKYDAAITYSGDAAYIMSENENYSFSIPENTNVFADGFVIPKNAQNKELAKKFIEFMSTYEASLDNTIEIGYTSVRNDVYTEMTKAGGDFSEPRLKYAYETKVSLFQIFRYDQKLKELIDQAWQRVSVS